MSDLLIEIKESICILTLNRVSKHNAFDGTLLMDLYKELDTAIVNPEVKVLILKANGPHFSAGADLDWMQSLVQASEAENLQDALVLGSFMHHLYHCPKPTIALVQGSAFGGGAGLAAACDIAIGADSARFCFSEVKLGLVPAVISPYVIEAIGARATKMLFMSAEILDAQRALELNLIHHRVPEKTLWDFGFNYAKQISSHAPEAVKLSKKLVEDFKGREINQQLVHDTAALIAAKRVSAEGQRGLKAFLNKEKTNWN